MTRTLHERSASWMQNGNVESTKKPQQQSFQPREKNRLPGLGNVSGVFVDSESSPATQEVGSDRWGGLFSPTFYCPVALCGVLLQSALSTILIHHKATNQSSVQFAHTPPRNAFLPTEEHRVGVSTILIRWADPKPSLKSLHA